MLVVQWKPTPGIIRTANVGQHHPKQDSTQNPFQVLPIVSATETSAMPHFQSSRVCISAHHKVRKKFSVLSWSPPLLPLLSMVEANPHSSGL